MDDLTEKLLKDLGSAARGADAQRMLKAKPAKVLDEGLMSVINELRKPSSDVTMGFVSAPLVYSSLIRNKPVRFRTAIYRMLKGEFLIVIEHRGGPPEGTLAYRDARYGNRYYELVMNPAKF